MTGFGIPAGPVTGPVLCRMFSEAMTGACPPQYLSTDHDPLFQFRRWKANRRILDVEEIKTIPFTPVSHPFIERLIGTLRREYLDRSFFWNSIDLHRKLQQFKEYYNHYRVHSALAGDAPSERYDKIPRKVLDLERYAWQSHCGGLFQIPVAA